jgi:hypothetical protein
VNHDIHLVILQHAGVDRGGPRGGHTEKDVGNFGGNHGPAPAVGQGVAHGLQQQALPVVVHPHVGAVHHFRGFAVDAPGCQIELLPHRPPFFGCAGHHLDGLLTHAVVFHHRIGQLPGDAPGALSVGDDTVLLGQAPEFGFIADFVADGRPVGYAGQHLHQITAVVGVRGGTGGNHAAQVAGHDNVGIGAAHTGLRPFAEGVHPARPHDADAA